jgi:hypothetical protein
MIAQSHHGLQRSLELLNKMLKISQKFKDYNVREYLLRRSKEKFEEDRASFISFAERELPWMERQSVVYDLYASDRASVLDNANTNSAGAGASRSSDYEK